ncbi:MAG: acyl-CoA dehydrogenase family protein [Acidimicrobiales bacterium]
MKLAWGEDEEAFRDELVRFLDARAPAEAKGLDWGARDRSEGQVIPQWARDWQATLFDHGWLVPGYPRELGGRDATPLQTLLYVDELAARGIPRSLHFPGYAIVAPSLLDHGDDRQRGLAPAALRGDTVWCVGMSEPGAGSDLAGLSTRAILDGDHFVVTGQKVWTSYAMEADMCLCYVRTNPDAPKHKGISALLVDMATPGIDVRPLRHLTGAAEFAEVFFADVVVPRANLLGPLDDGWRITVGSLAHERGGLWVQGVATAEGALRDLVALAHERGRNTDPVVRRRLAEGAQRIRSLRALGYKGFATLAATGSSPEHAYLKLATSELSKQLFELGVELAGPYEGRWAHSFFMSFAATIAGGSSEIQRNIIAERVLGLPREPSP